MSVLSKLRSLPSKASSYLFYSTFVSRENLATRDNLHQTKRINNISIWWYRLHEPHHGPGHRFLPKHISLSRRDIDICKTHPV